MAESANPSNNESVALPLRHVAAVVAGNALEFYDFMTYSFFALQIGRTFFPSHNPLSSLLASLATFGAGFLTRPLGAYVIGRIADRTGRRPAMLLTFWLMGIAIAGIALTPSYSAIGSAAPILVVSWRLMQGFALGGEVGPTASFLIEAAPQDRRGIYGSLLVGTSGIAVFAAGLVGYGLSSFLEADSLDNWGWRIAFLIGAAVVPLGLAIRRSLPETLHAVDAASITEPGRRGGYTTAALLGLVILASGTMLTYARAYMTTYAVGILGMSSRAAFICTIINGFCTLVFYLIGGWISDRYGRRPVMIIFTLLLAAIALPTFMAINNSRTPEVLYASVALLTAVTGLGQGCVMTAIAESLPQHVRAGALGTIYAVAIAIFGGSAQFVVVWLIGATGNPLVPGWYLLGAALFGLAAMVKTRETAPVVIATARLLPVAPL
jgi:MHS family citrate/tricarballylate:H+ symporter-like MFS transporter